jgi:hypothetical protein
VDVTLDQLAQQGRWPALWDRVRATSLDRAVPAMRLFGDWQPGESAARALFARLAAAEPATIAAAAAPAVTTIPVRFSNHLAFAPDLTRIAVQPTLGEPGTTEIYTLPGADLVARLGIVGERSPWSCQLVYVDGAVVHLEWREDDRRRWRVVRHRLPDWSREVLADSVEGHAVRIGAIPGGFVVVAPHHFLLGTADGPLSEPIAHPALRDRTAMLLTTDPASGRMAVTLEYEEQLLVFDAGLRVLGEVRLRHAEAHCAWFCGPETLVTYGRFRALRSWLVQDGSLVVRGHTWLPKIDTQFGNHSFPLGLTTMPSRRLVAFERAVEPPLWYDAGSLREVAAPATFADRFPVWLSPSDQYAIFQDAQGLHVHDVGLLDLARLVTTPRSDVTRADLATVGTLAAGRLSAENQLTVDLLHAFLTHETATR